MRALSFFLIAAVLLFAPVAAPAQSPPPLGKPIFCDGTYALCIKALCEPIAEKKMGRSDSPIAFAMYARGGRWVRSNARPVTRSSATAGPT